MISCQLREFKGIPNRETISFLLVSTDAIDGIHEMELDNEDTVYRAVNVKLSYSQPGELNSCKTDSKKGEGSCSTTLTEGMFLQITMEVSP